MTFVSTYVERPGIDLLDGLATSSISYMQSILEKYVSLAGYDPSAESDDWDDLDFYSDLMISSNYSHKDEKFHAILECNWRDEEDESWQQDFYKLEFLLNDNNRYETKQVSTLGGVEFDSLYYDGTLVYSEFDDDDNVIKSLNIDTGEIRVEELLSNNINYYADKGAEGRIHIDKFFQYKELWHCGDTRGRRRRFFCCRKYRSRKSCSINRIKRRFRRQRWLRNTRCHRRQKWCSSLHC